MRPRSKIPGGLAARLALALLPLAALPLTILVAPAPAAAHCVSPDPIRPMFRAGAAGEIELYLNFASALSIDDGATWKIQCEEIFQDISIPLGPNNFVLAPGGNHLVAHFQGLYITKDRGCNYVAAAGVPKTGDPGMESPSSITDVAVDPTDPDNALWAVIDDTLFRSNDAGACVKPVHRFCGDTLLRIITSPDGKMIYVLSFVPVGSGSDKYLSSSGDGGKTWERTKLPYEELTLARVAPTDGNVLYAVNKNTDQELLQSKDRGKTWSKLFDGKRGTIMGFDAKVYVALGAAAGELWVGVRGDDNTAGNGQLHHSTDDGKTWTQITGTQPHFRCLEFSGGKLWGCGNNSLGMGDAFVLGSSTDGVTWTKKLAFGELCRTISASKCDAILMSACVPGLCGSPPGPVAMGPTCASTGLTTSAVACTYTVDACPVGPDAGAGPEAGGEAGGAEPLDAGNRDAAQEAPGATDGGGCCRTAGGGGGGDGLAGVAGVFALLAARASRRRR